MFDYIVSGQPSAGPSGAPALIFDKLNSVLYVWNGTALLTGVKSPATAVTAFSGGGQSSATQLSNDINNISTTVATTPPYDSVKLPTSSAGRSVVVINSTSNPIQVFGAGTDTINGIASGTGITQPPNSVDIYWCGIAGSWFVEAGVGFSGQLFTELAQDSITAHAGGGQGSATQITAQTNRITTVTTAGDSIVLPASAPGLELMVINHGANVMQVFGLGTDQIDDQASATGVAQMANSLVIYTCASAGKWYSEGLATGFGGPGLQTMSIANNLTAFAGGGQGSALALAAMINRVTTVTTAGDSVRLPSSAAGLEIMVINKGANPLQVFGAGTDTINGIATATGISQGINTNAVYVCSVAGNWEVPLTSLWSSTPQAIGTAAPALPPHTSHTYVFNRAGVVAATLAAPTSVTDDGIEIQITSDSANAHTITSTGNLDTGTTSVNAITFAAQKGASVNLMAFNGRWKVLSANGATFS